MTMRDMNNNEAIEVLNRCKHEITNLRETVNYLKPKADAYDNISTIIRMFFVQPQGFASDDLVRIIQKRIDELTPKASTPETNPINTKPAPEIVNKSINSTFDLDPYSAKLNETSDAQPTARGYVDA